MPASRLPESTPADDRPLAERSVAAALWGAFGSALRIVVQVVAQIVLARLLGPEQYGLFAICVIVISFSSFFSDVGMAYGLIQKPSVSEDDIAFVFGWQIVLGITVAAAVAFLGEPIAWFFNERRVVPIIHWLAVICLLNALTAVSLNLLKRNLDYRTLSITQAFAYFCGYVVVGIPLALAGWEVWALVAAWLVQATVTLAALYRRAGHALRPRLGHEGGWAMVRYGLTVFVTNMLNWLIGNVDRVVAGRAFPGAGVGLYATSFNLVNTPAVAVMGVLQPVLFSACSRAQNDPVRLRRGFLSIVGAVALFSMPLFAGVAAVADTVIVALYGPAWHAAGALLQPLALAMPLYLLVGMATPLLWASGKVTREFLVQVPVALVWVGACAWSATYSLERVAWVVLGLFLVRAFVMLAAAARALGVPLSDVVRSVGGGAQVAALVATGLYLADALLRRWVDHPALWLAGDVLVASVLSGAALVFARWLVAPELKGLLDQVSARMPGPVARAVRLVAHGTVSR